MKRELLRDRKLQENLAASRENMPLSAYDVCAIRKRAREIWNEREQGFPAFVRQRWEQGTQLARDATLLRAAQELGVFLVLTDPLRDMPDLHPRRTGE